MAYQPIRYAVVQRIAVVQPSVDESLHQDLVLEQVEEEK